MWTTGLSQNYQVEASGCLYTDLNMTMGEVAGLCLKKRIKLRQEAKFNSASILWCGNAVSMKPDIIMMGRHLIHEILISRKHHVMAISRKFEVYTEKPHFSTDEEIARHLTPFIRRCFPADCLPRDIDDPFLLGKDKEKETISKRIVYGIRELFVSRYALS
jgi:hypothetical protein